MITIILIILDFISDTFNPEYLYLGSVFLDFSVVLALYCYFDNKSQRRENVEIWKVRQ